MGNVVEVGRFWDKVDRSGGAASCWPWTACRNKKGYGFMSARRPDGSKTSELAHRASWVIAFGPLADATSCVLHKCDNPQCVNPGHLFLGSKIDNNRDMRAKKRDAVGERMSTHKLTDAAVRRIRADSRSHRVIAAELGVNRSLVSLVKTGRIWRHVV